MIEAKVAGIMDARTLVLNKGSDDGVEIGMRFAILNSNGAEIRDPETGEVLGSVDIDKTVVKIVDVKERVAVARTYRKVGGRTGLTDALFVTSAFASRPPRLETLRTDEATYKEELSENESYVKTGDVAIQFTDDKFGGASE